MSPIVMAAHCRTRHMLVRLFIFVEMVLWKGQTKNQEQWNYTGIITWSILAHMREYIVCQCVTAKLTQAASK